MRRLWLIACREFCAYVATLSFWVALAVGPAMLGLAALLVFQPPRPPAPQTLTLDAGPANFENARDALLAASRASGQSIVVVKFHGAETVRPSVVMRVDPGGHIRARLAEGALSIPARAVFEAELSRREGLQLLAQRARDPEGVAAAKAITATTLVDAPTPADPMGPARFSLVLMLWLTLTGSLGMLLQAVVRERANRALESLLAAARPAEIVLGKLIGVGAVSVLILAVWMGAAAGLAALAPSSLAAGARPFAGLADVTLLGQAVLIYVLTFTMYGAVTVALGAAARDSASAQNLSRPMFAVLLIAFFAALAAGLGARSSLAWLTWAPPFTPFMLLLRGAELSAGAQLAACAILVTSATGAVVVAARSISPRGRLGRTA